MFDGYDIEHFLNHGKKLTYNFKPYGYRLAYFLAIVK